MEFKDINLMNYFEVIEEMSLIRSEIKDKYVRLLMLDSEAKKRCANVPSFTAGRKEDYINVMGILKDANQ